MAVAVVVNACLMMSFCETASFRDSVYSHIKDESLGLKSPWIGDVSHVQSVYSDGVDSSVVDSYYDKDGYLTKQIFQRESFGLKMAYNANVSYGKNHELDSIVIDEGDKHTVVFQNCYADSIVIEATISESNKISHNKRVFCFGDTDIAVLSHEEVPMRNFMYFEELHHEYEDEYVSSLESSGCNVGNAYDFSVKEFIRIDADSMKLDYVFAEDNNNGQYEECYKTEYFGEVGGSIKLIRQIGGEFSFCIIFYNLSEPRVAFSQELPFVLCHVNDQYNNRKADGMIETDEKGNTIRDYGWSHIIEYR